MLVATFGQRPGAELVHHVDQTRQHGLPNDLAFLRRGRFLLCPHMPNALTFFLAVSFSGFFTDLTMGPAWAVCQDIGRRYAAIVAGTTNMIGALGGTLASWVTGFVIQRSLAAHAVKLGQQPQDLSAVEKTVGELPGYHLNFLLFAGVFVVGTIC